jgi:hypothetical protein
MMNYASKMVNSLRVALNENQVVFGRRFSVSGRTVGNWESGRLPADATQKKIVQLYQRTLPNTAKATEGKPTAVGASEPQWVGNGRKRLSALLSPPPSRFVVHATDVHDAINEFHTIIQQDHLLKALDLVSKKYDISQSRLRSAVSVFLYLAEEIRPPVTLKQLISVLSGHEEPH